MEQETKTITVVIPCYNEELTIGKVIKDFQEQLPQAKIVVYDNNSIDKTASIAKLAGAEVRTCSRQGKGAVLRKAFHELETDIFVVVDGDDTYPADKVHDLIAAVKNGADMAVGDRISDGHYFKENKRPLHNFGNSLVCKSINLLFRGNITDAMSGYRAMSKRFIKTCPILNNGFEVETEMTIHAIDKLFQIEEIPVPYRDRPPGSFSKLNTLSDGFLVLHSILWLFKDSKPLIFFTLLASLQFLGALLNMGLQAYNLGLNQATPTLVITGTITLCAAFILDSLSKFHKENFEIHLLQTPEK